MKRSSTDDPIKEFEERVECGHCGGMQALFDGVRCAAQLEDICTCPVEPPEMTEMKREQAHMAAALAMKEKTEEQLEKIKRSIGYEQ